MNDERPTSNPFENLGEGIGKGLVKYAIYALSGALFVGTGGVVVHNRSVSDAKQSQAWVGDDFHNHTVREDQLQQQINEQQSQIDELRKRVNKLTQ